MTEREHCEAVARRWWENARVGGAGLRDLDIVLERERAAAWLEGRNAGLDAAKRAFDGILAPTKASGAFRALAEIGLAVAFGRAMELLDFAQFQINVTPNFVRRIEALLHANSVEDVVP